MKVRVVNKRNWRADGAYIGRPSALGNPFSVKEYGRAECIARYEDWFRSELKRGGRVAAEMDRLERILRIHKDLVLICWCAPLACHGDVIKRELERRVK